MSGSQCPALAGMGGAGVGGAAPAAPAAILAPPKQKAKKPPSTKKLISSKITGCGNKLTDVKVWKNKLENSAL